MKTFILYDEAMARQEATRVRLQGLDLTRFKKNPIMLYMHQRVPAARGPAGSEVIGRWTGVRIQEGRLLADAVFDKSDTWSSRIADKVQKGFLRGASIGISVLESQEHTEEGKTYLEVQQSVLLEASIVDIPQNENALSNQCLMYETLSYSPKGPPMPAVLSVAAVRAALGLEGTDGSKPDNVLAQVRSLAQEGGIAPVALQAALGIKGKHTPEDLLGKVEQLVAQAAVPTTADLQEASQDKGRTPAELAHFLQALQTHPTPPSVTTSQYAYLLKHQPEVLRVLQRKQPAAFARLLEAHLQWKKEQLKPKPKT